MSNTAASLNYEQLINVLSFTKMAVAVHVGEDAKIEFANQAMLTIWGRGPEVIGKSLQVALPELLDQPFIEMFAKVWREGITISGSDTPADLVIDGLLDTYYFDFEYRAITDENGVTIAILHSATDVTERYLNRRALEQASENKKLLMYEQSVNQRLAITNEKLKGVNVELKDRKQELLLINDRLENLVKDRVNALVESEERFRSMADNTDVLISVINENGRLEYLNKSWVQLSGRNIERLLIDGWHDLIHPMDKQIFFKIIQKSIAQRISYSAEIRLLGADGIYHWLLEKGTPRFFIDGSFAGYISSCVNITQLKLGEAKLQDLNDELEASNKSLATVNEELGKANIELLYSEQRFRNLIRKAPVAICVIRAEDLTVTEVNDLYLKLVGKSRKELENYPIWEIVKEAAAVYSPIMQRVIASNIPFHALEHELILNRHAVDETVFVDFVYEPVTDLEGIVNSVMVVGNDVTDKVIARRAIEDIEERNRLAIEASEIGTFEVTYIDQLINGSKRFDEIFDVQSPISKKNLFTKHHPLDIGNFKDAYMVAKKTGKLFYETRLLTENNSLKWVRIQGNIHYDKNGIPNKLLGTVMDITVSRQLQQQKDDFISIASHELKTPLTSLKASIQLLNRMKTNPGKLLPKLIEQANNSVNNISDLVEDLLNVNKIDQGKIILNLNKFNLRSTIEESCSQVFQTVKREIIITCDNYLEIFADENRIQQVIINYVANAIKYAPLSEQIYINVEEDNFSVKLSVRDTGNGIPAENLPYLFERYYRVNSNGIHASGLGLGLYICADIIERHGGKIGVESIENLGSTFWFSLPKKQENAGH